jgi:hypothetical protein
MPCNKNRNAIRSFIALRLQIDDRHRAQLAKTPLGTNHLGTEHRGADERNQSIFHGHYLTQISQMWRFNIFWAIMNYLWNLQGLVKFGLSRGCKECMKLIGFANWCFEVPMWCSITHTVVSMFAEGFLVHASQITPCLSLRMQILKKKIIPHLPRQDANTFFHVMMHHHAKFEFIWRMYTWGKRAWSSHSTPQLWVWVCHGIFLLMFLFFMDAIWHK